MRASQRKQHEPVWSPRSQRSWKKQVRLEAARERIRGLVVFTERKIAEGKETSARQADTFSTTGSYAIWTAMNRTLTDIAERERELKVYREREKSLTAEIEAESYPSPAQLAERAKHQAALASIIIERGAKDAEIDAAVKKLRKALCERAALTTKALKVADLIDFAPDVDFDASRFAVLESALPTDVSGASREWVGTFLGVEGEKQSYTVGRTGAIVPEVLYDAGVYRPGEIVFLSRKRAKMLPLDEEPKPLPGPAEMETQAGNVLQPTEHKPVEADQIQVSGFPVR